MLFVEWWFVGRICLGLLIVAVSIFSFWLVRTKRGLVRIPIRIVSGFVAVCDVLGWLIILAFPTPRVYSIPVYSPNRKMAVRIDDYNASGFGGAYNCLALFTLYGLKSDVVYSGEWSSIRTADLRWRSDSELEILYDRPDCACKSTHQVSVRCKDR